MLSRISSKGITFPASRRTVATQATLTMPPPLQSGVKVDFSSTLEEKLSSLQARKASWATLPLPEKIRLLKEVKGRLMDKSRSQAQEGANLRAQAMNKALVSDELLLTGVALAVYIDNLSAALETIHTTGRCAELPLRTLHNGQQVAKVFPVTKMDQGMAGFLFSNLTADVYIQPGKPATQGSLYLSNQKSGGKVVAMLGAGNHGFLGFKDILYVLFECNNVALFKPHPLQAAWHSYADHVLEPLSKRGFYHSVYTTSVQETAEMLYHPKVEAVHMTGGTATHDAIVWGADREEQVRRKAENDPVLKVPMTSELGCVSPWLVTPGQWSEEQLDCQAGCAAAAIMSNTSCNCNSLKVLVLPEAWPQADDFLKKMKSALAKGPLPAPWYPGIHQRYESWKAAVGSPEVISAPPVPTSKDCGGPSLPFLIQELPYPEEGSDLTSAQQYAFTVEPFAPVLSVVRIPATSVPDYLQKASRFCNERLWGTLSCSVLMHPDVERDYPGEAEQVLHDLCFGTVLVNSWSAIGYTVPHSLWGAFGGDQTLADVGSGMGHINNTHFIDHPQKAVIRVPLVSSTAPKPPSEQSIPVPVAQALAGYLAGGWIGIPKSLLFSR